METLRVRLKGSLLPSKASVVSSAKQSKEDFEETESDFKSSEERVPTKAKLIQSSSDQFTHRRMSQPTKVVSRFVMFEANNERRLTTSKSMMSLPPVGLTFSERLIPVLQMSRQMSVDNDGGRDGPAKHRKLPHSKSVQELCHHESDSRGSIVGSNRQLRPTRQLTHV